MTRIPSSTGLNMPDRMFNDKITARAGKGGKDPSKRMLGIYRQEDVADMLSYMLTLHPGTRHWKYSAEPIKDYTEHSRAHFATIYDVRARNEGDAGITFIGHIYSAMDKSVYHIAVDTALKTDPQTHAVHNHIQIKPPKAPGCDFTSVQMALDLCKDHYYFQVYAATTPNGRTASTFYYIRLIPMWVLPPEAFRVMGYTADPTQVMADVSHVGTILGAEYLKWASFKPGLSVAYQAVWDYLPERIKRLEAIRPVYHRPNLV